MSELLEKIKETIPEAQEAIEKLNKADSLHRLVMATLLLVRLVGVRLLVEKLQQMEAPHPGDCPDCGNRLESKGKKPRALLTLLGTIRWKRRIYRCPNRCQIGQICPLDQKLQIEPGSQTCTSVKRPACLLAILMPYQLSSTVLRLLTGVHVTPMTIWNWVQHSGSLAMQRLEAELEQISQEDAWKVPLPEHLKPHLLAVGADGVMAPFRPNGGSPEGQTCWREVKVGLVAWLREHTTKTGKRSLRPVQREVTAFLGEVDEFKPRLWLAALNQGILKAKRAVWLSDGGRGYWGVFDDYIAPYATGVLDFYHAAQNLWKGMKEWLDGRTKKARSWFRKNRRRLRDGKADVVLDEVENSMKVNELPDSTKEALEKLHKYLSKHIEHIDYERFKELGFPLGSGIIESTCKWLIQQRFKGVGMRWSERGFNHLLHLRLAWVNGTYFRLWDEEELEEEKE